EDSLPEGFRYVFDLSTPSCRLLNQPYNPADTENTQHYVIYGFIVSPNITVTAVETLDLGFENSDHNPVFMTVNLSA
ncbi:MAG: endonuclease, partial [Oscillospiraceae bacterium]|nr:endonuclease [Oscillospiraceae bacterium]